MKADGSTRFISLGVESKGARYGNLRLVDLRAPIVEAKNDAPPRDFTRSLSKGWVWDLELQARKLIEKL
jgi:hypothetical protein